MTTTVRSDAPVSDTVYFKVTVRTYEREGHWMAEALETGIIAYGETREDAVRILGEANVAVVKRWKLRGREALERCFSERGITPSFDEQQVVEPLGDIRDLAA